MSNLLQAAGSRNAAIYKISGGKVRGVANNKNIKQLAAENTAKADNSAQINDQIEEEQTADERKILYKALAISLGVVVLFFVLLKFKLIKL